MDEKPLLKKETVCPRCNHKLRNEDSAAEGLPKPETNCSNRNLQLEPMGLEMGTSSSNYQSSQTTAKEDADKPPSYQKQLIKKIKKSFSRLTVRSEGWLASSGKRRLQKQISNQIDRKLNKEKQLIKNWRTILVIGTAQAGKSTIIKQIRNGSLVHDHFSEVVLSKLHFKKNLLVIMLSIMDAMVTLIPPVPLEKPENQKNVNYLKIFTPRFNDHSSEFFERIEALWNDKGVQTAFERRNEYHLQENAKYFLDRISTIKQDHYEASEEDFLHCHVPSEYITEDHIEIDGINFVVIEISDVSLYSSLRKWIHYFENIYAVIFVAACNSYNLTLSESPERNQFQRSLNLFTTVCNNRYLYSIPFFLFLNKQDLLLESVLEKKTKLEDHFAGYSTYQLPAGASNETHEPSEVIHAKQIILDEFLPIYKASKYGYLSQIYHHFTCAMDKESIKHAFDHCVNMIANFKGR